MHIVEEAVRLIPEVSSYVVMSATHQYKKHIKILIYYAINNSIQKREDIDSLL